MTAISNFMNRSFLDCDAKIMDSVESHLKLAGCVKSYVGIFFFGHSEDESCFGQENGLIVFVVSNVGLAIFHEVFEVGFFATHPAGFVNAARFEPTFCAVFVF